jgi:hypothetical protein
MGDFWKGEKVWETKAKKTKTRDRNRRAVNKTKRQRASKTNNPKENRDKRPCGRRAFPSSLT